MLLKYYEESFKFIGNFNDIMCKKNFFDWHKDCSTVRKFLALAGLGIIWWRSREWSEIQNQWYTPGISQKRLSGKYMNSGFYTYGDKEEQENKSNIGEKGELYA